MPLAGNQKFFLAFIHREYLNQELTSSQKQAVIKMLGKKGEDKRCIKNWRIRIKNISPFLISPNGAC